MGCESLPFCKSEKLNDIVSQNMKTNLSKKGLTNFFEKIYRRVAVFSDTMDLLPAGEIQTKLYVWDYLDSIVASEAGQGEVQTLFTGLAYGADSAAAEYFVNKKETNKSLNIVYLESENYSQVNMPVTSFVTSSFFPNKNYTKNLKENTDRQYVNPLHYMIDQCFHLLFLLDPQKDEMSSTAWRMFDYAITTHPHSISHCITTIYLEGKTTKEENALAVGNPSGAVPGSAAGGTEFFQQLTLF